MENGVIYITFKNLNKKVQSLGQDFYLKELVYSMKTVKRQHPNLNITVFTDFKEFHSKYCDNVRFISPDGERVKQIYLQQSPYQNTLYLDSDIAVKGNIIELFDLLNRFDIAATFDHMRKNKKCSEIWKDYAKIPDGFSEYAGGVILFRKSKAVDNFFNIWRTKYKEWCKLSGKINDQPSFRVSLYFTKNLHVYTLPPEYNIRTKKYHNIIPRIFHFHEMSDEKVQTALNNWKTKNPGLIK